MLEENKVYTRTGDDGTTALISGKRVPKHNLRIKANGALDELIAWLGVIRDHLSKNETEQFLFQIQNELMNLAAQLAVPEQESLPNGVYPVSDQQIERIEKEIDFLTQNLPPLQNFVIPGGHILVSYAHLARSVCRRAERDITELNETETIQNECIIYVNRLSDYLFTLSRKFGQEQQIEETKWVVR
ncbi:MAG: cob(I)yrinic acid a,c-diamide adenosyltransferase [Flavobacteriaceae bacterium]